MASIIADLKARYRRADLSLRLVYVNTVVFLLAGCLQVGFRLFNRDLSGVLTYVELPASLARLARQPWTLLTYMFVHFDLLHLVFNMIWLYVFGRLFHQRFTAKHLRGVYLLGGIGGGVLYVAAYNLFPYFAPVVDGSWLIGASASVLAIVCAIAYREPEYRVQVFLVGSIRLKYLALAAIVIDLLLITSGNAGGHIAHLGGALTGLAFTAFLDRGHDLTAWINRILDFVGHPPKLRRRQPKMKVSRGGTRAADYEYNAQRRQRNDEIDRILEKLKASGYQSLTSEEKKTLFDASKR